MSPLSSWNIFFGGQELGPRLQRVPSTSFQEKVRLLPHHFAKRARRSQLGAHALLLRTLDVVSQIFADEIAQSFLALRRGGLGSNDFNTRPDDVVSPFIIQRTVTLLRFSSVETSQGLRKCDTTSHGGNAGTCARCRGMFGVRIQSGICGDQDVSTHSRPRCQGQNNRPSPCTSLLKFSGRGSTRTAPPRLGTWSWVDPASARQ